MRLSPLRSADRPRVTVRTTSTSVDDEPALRGVVIGGPPGGAG